MEEFLHGGNLGSLPSAAIGAFWVPELRPLSREKKVASPPTVLIFDWFLCWTQECAFFFAGFYVTALCLPQVLYCTLDRAELRQGMIQL